MVDKIECGRERLINELHSNGLEQFAASLANTPS
jgi:hypothetical protein